MLNFLNNSLLHKRCQKYALFQKLFQTEVVMHSVSYQKVMWAHMSVTPRRGVTGFQRLEFSKYYYGQKRQSKFTLGPNTVENMHHFKNYFQRKLLSIQFRTKNSAGAYVYHPWEKSYELPKIDIFKILLWTKTAK